MRPVRVMRNKEGQAISPLSLIYFSPFPVERIETGMHDVRLDCRSDGSSGEVTSRALARQPGWPNRSGGNSDVGSACALCHGGVWGQEKMYGHADFRLGPRVREGCRPARLTIYILPRVAQGHIHIYKGCPPASRPVGVRRTDR